MTAPLLRQAANALHNAQVALDRYRAATDFPGREREWTYFLGDVDRCWIKLEKAATHPAPGLQHWKSTSIRARKVDPLLCYLHHARNADLHGLIEVVAHTGGALRIEVAPGFSSGFVDMMVIDDAGQVHFGPGTRGMRAVHVAPRTELTDVTDRGRPFPVPTEHLGDRIRSRDPLAVAPLAVAWYRARLDELTHLLRTHGAA